MIFSVNNFFLFFKLFDFKKPFIDSSFEETNGPLINLTSSFFFDGIPSIHITSLLDVEKIFIFEYETSFFLKFKLKSSSNFFSK